MQIIHKGINVVSSDKGTLFVADSSVIKNLPTEIQFNNREFIMRFNDPMMPRLVVRAPSIVSTLKHGDTCLFATRPQVKVKYYQLLLASECI